ncbi:flagellar basal-body MS-ring/collar protein FliF [Tatumella ptyseos]|uniref:flagellar basal-body MS-ring/collar protein FliF n=1 Tax=Tatumella ptyseos TaxID=82987 RepID=UPI0026EC5C2C|nr:flagellar basal-body MS-ring/collar protein FliF [Tatumella ptyseos]WKX25395.1 flagellar basal-body MS-ring/collar protein FliF [Tatumella ptyseos]
MSLNTATLPTSLWSRVQQSVATLRDQQKVILIVTTALSFAVIAALALWARSPDYRTLYGSLSEAEGGNIVSALTKMNVPYQLDPHTGAILVPSQQVRELRLRLASQGLPKSSTTGFELLDDEKFGLSQFNEQVNYQRALAGELSRTIETLDPVVSARVHLAIPRPSVFVREKQPPTAAVTLTLQPGRVLDASQINAVVHLVASSVAGMSADNVTVVDQAGELLSGAGLAAQTQNTTQLKYTQRVEKTVQQRIEQLLRPIVGQQNLRAQVTAEVNFDQQEQTDERYQPNSEPSKQAIRSAQRSQSELTAQQAEGVPGALSNQPTPPAQANIEGDKKSDASTSKAKRSPLQMNNESTVNYELDKTTRRTLLSTGGIKRLSVAVVVNYQTDKEGKEAALSTEKINQITSLVKQAMGYSEARGDTVNVVNTPFTAHEFTDDYLPWWQQPQWISLATQTLRWLVVLIIAFILYRKIVSPALRHVKETLNPAPIEIPQETSTVDPSLNEAARKAQLRINAEQMSQRIRTMSENEPQVVALVIRDWMGSEL